MGWAQLWRSKERDGFMRQTILTGQHAPARYRANGPLSHLDAFYETFGVGAGRQALQGARTAGQDLVTVRSLGASWIDANASRKAWNAIRRFVRLT